MAKADEKLLKFLQESPKPVRVALVDYLSNNSDHNNYDFSKMSLEDLESLLQNMRGEKADSSELRETIIEEISKRIGQQSAARTSSAMNKVTIDGYQFFCPTREDVESLKVGDKSYIETKIGDTGYVSRIQYRGVNIYGKAYIAFTVTFGDGSRSHCSLMEGETYCPGPTLHDAENHWWLHFEWHSRQTGVDVDKCHQCKAHLKSK